MTVVRTTLLDYLEDEGRQTRSTVLPARVFETLKKIGDGDVAAGLFWLVEEHLKQHPAVRGPYPTKRS